MSPAAVQLWGPRHNYKMESWKFSTGDKGPLPRSAASRRRWKNTRAPAEKLISPLNARLLYALGRALELKWAPRKPASAGRRGGGGRGPHFMANGRESRRPVRLLSSSPSSLRRSLVFFFILRRPRYTSGERLQTVQTRSSRTVAGKVWRHLLLCKIPPFLSLFFFFLFRVSRRILLERRREIFLSLRFGRIEITWLFYARYNYYR